MAVQELPAAEHVIKLEYTTEKDFSINPDGNDEYI